MIRQNPDRPVKEIVSARMVSSGMAAISHAILAKVRCGQTIIAQNSLYSATFTFLNSLKENYGINVVFTAGLSNQDWEDAFASSEDPALVYAETPANPTLALVDLRYVADLAHQHHAWLVVDNTFATPFCQRPLTLGADVVIHSTTKYLSGHGTTIGGVVVSRHPEFIAQDFYSTFKVLGGAPAPADCWLTSLGLRTFPLRMAAHCKNALAIAAFLQSHPRVAKVYYPGLPDFPDYKLAQKQMIEYGGMVAFEVKGGVPAGAWLLNHLQVVTLAVSLGNTDTLISHPASMTHSHLSSEVRNRMGISDGLVRLSVGIEDVEDLIKDLDQALNSYLE